MSKEILNLARAIVRFEESHARSLAPRTLTGYMHYLSILEDALGHDCDPSSITTQDAESVLASSRFDHLSNTTVSQCITVWNRFSDWGRRRFGWEDWARDLERPRRDKPELRRLTRSEVAGMLSFLEVHEYDRTIVWLLAYTAARREEIRLIRWGEIDLVEGVLRILLGKGGKGRLIPIPRVLVGYLALVKEHRPAEQVTDEAYCIPFSQVWMPPGHDLIRRVDPSRPPSPTTIGRAVKRVAKAAGVRAPHEITPHMFRRHLLEDGNEAGRPTITLADIAGHADVRTTQGYTGAASLNAMRALMDDLDFLDDHDVRLGE